MWPVPLISDMLKYVSMGVAESLPIFMSQVPFDKVGEAAFTLVPIG
jgi:hypothetical protein